MKEKNPAEIALKVFSLVKRLTDDLDCNLSILPDHFDHLNKDQKTSLFHELEALTQNIHAVISYLTFPEECRSHFDTSNKDQKTRTFITHEGNQIIIRVADSKNPQL